MRNSTPQRWRPGSLAACRDDLAHHPHFFGVAGEMEAEAELGPELEGPHRLQEHAPRPDVHHRALELLPLANESRPVFEPHREPLGAAGGHGQELVEAPIPDERVEGNGKHGVGPRLHQHLGALAAEAPVENRDGGGARVGVGAKGAHERLHRGELGQGDDDQAGRAHPDRAERLLGARHPVALETPAPQARMPQLRLGIGRRDDQDLGQAPSASRSIRSGSAA